LQPCEWPPAAAQAQPAEALFQGRYSRAIVLAVLTAVFNQLCGVTILRVYLIDLLASTGMETQLAHNLGLLVALLNVVALLGGLMLVDHVGRRPLLVAGSTAMTVTLLFLVAALNGQPHPGFYVAILAAYNFAFAASQGAVGWVYISEIFPYAVRGKGQGLAAWVHWVVNAALVGLYPVLEAWLPRPSFLLFAAATAVQVLVVLIWFPETKGRRLGELEYDRVRRRQPSR
jgi:MFS family permease